MPSDDSEHYYFVCRRCNAKWFAVKRRVACPRCSAVAQSRERLRPPWRKPLTTITDLSQQSEASGHVVTDV